MLNGLTKCAVIAGTHDAAAQYNRRTTTDHPRHLLEELWQARAYSAYSVCEVYHPHSDRSRLSRVVHASEVAGWCFVKTPSCGVVVGILLARSPEGCRARTLSTNGSSGITASFFVLVPSLCVPDSTLVPLRKPKSYHTMYMYPSLRSRDGVFASGLRPVGRCCI